MKESISKILNFFADLHISLIPNKIKCLNLSSHPHGSGGLANMTFLFRSKHFIQFLAKDFHNLILTATQPPYGVEGLKR